MPRRRPPESTTPDHLRFGYEHMIFMRDAEARLLAEGVPQREVYLRACHEWDESRKGRPTLRQRQEAARARGEKWVSPLPGPPMTRLALTDEEADYLREKLAGVNDPVGAAVLAKLTRQ